MGLFVGTPAVTSRGMVESDMEMVAGYLDETVDIARAAKAKTSKS